MLYNISSHWMRLCTHIEKKDTDWNGQFNIQCLCRKKIDREIKFSLLPYNQAHFLKLTWMHVNYHGCFSCDIAFLLCGHSLYDQSSHSFALIASYYVCTASFWCLSGSMRSHSSCFCCYLQNRWLWNDTILNKLKAEEWLSLAHGILNLLFQNEMSCIVATHPLHNLASKPLLKSNLFQIHDFFY